MNYLEDIHFVIENFLSLIKPNSSPLDKIQAYLSCHERDWVPDQEKIFNLKTNFSWKSINSIFTPFFDNSLSPLNQVFLADYNGKLLYNFNPINTQVIKFFNMELFTPLLNNHLLESAPHMKKSLKYDVTNNIGKLPLRNILKKNGHDVLVSKQKLGFNVNTLNLWKKFGHKICKEFLDDSRVVSAGWINNNWIQKHIDSPEGAVH